MQQQESAIVPQYISQLFIDRARSSLQKHIKEDIIAASLYGPRMRGYADACSENDIIFLIRRRNSEYLNISSRSNDATPAAVIDELKQQEFNRLNRLVTEETGTKTACTFIDERRLIIGVMQGNPMTVGALEFMSKNSKYVRANYLPVYEKYFNHSAFALQYLEVARQQIYRLSQASENHIYRQERNYLTALWCILRALEFFNEFTYNEKPAELMQMPDLITNTCSVNSESCPALTDERLFAPFYRRINRYQLEDLVSITPDESNLLLDLFKQTTMVVSKPFFSDLTKKADYDQIAQELVCMLVRNEEYFKKGRDNDE